MTMTVTTYQKVVSHLHLENVKYLFSGMFFGVILVKSEVLSWYRIQEMFRFQSFHMYGVIGSAIAVGALSIWLIKRYNVKTIHGDAITFTPKARTWPRYILGGTLFGLGWAMTGACPGPMAALLGTGASVFLVVMISAILGTRVYGMIMHKLPH